MKDYDIRDISLAPSGHRKIEWVKNNMPLLSALEEEFRKDTVSYTHLTLPTILLV